MCEKKLVFSYCEGAYCTQIGNISRGELSPRPSGLSVLKILLHEHHLDDGVLHVILGVSDKSDDVLRGGLLFDQKWVCLLQGRFGGSRLDCFIFGISFLWISSCL